jgi:hypothetical protein
MVDGLDGRSAVARRWKDLALAYADDLGGMNNLTEAQRTLISQAATLQLESERLQALVLKGKTVDTEGLTRLANATQRVLQQLGARRPPPRRGPDLHEYLAKHDEAAT